MKGGVTSYTVPAKRRWRGLVVAVLGLVFLSMLVPLAFLLGLHNGFLSSPGYDAEQGSSSSIGITVYDRSSGVEDKKQLEADKSTHVDELIRRLRPILPKESGKNPEEEMENKINGSPAPANVSAYRPEANKIRGSDSAGKADNSKGTDEIVKFCELRFGSYCIWGREHREKMIDSIVKKMKDRLYVARAYYPSIAKLPAFDKLTHELKQNIQEFERVLSEATTDKDLPPQIEKKIDNMEASITKAKSCPVDCNNVDKKLRQLVDLTEDEANFHMKQSVFLYQLAVQTMPKSLHCLSMRLTVEYFRSSLDMEELSIEKYSNPDLYHYVIFSNNVLASSAVINSTIMHAKESENQVFHVLTDKENYFSMKVWFFRNKYKEATVQVLNVEDLKLNGPNTVAPQLFSMPEEFRVSFRSIDKKAILQTRTEYLSVFSHSHYLLPEIFPTLKKIVVLDDDVIVQRDLSALWSINMGGKVNGAVQFCAVKLIQLKHYFSNNTVEDGSCAWMSGLNIVDLVQWRERALTRKYQNFVQEISAEEGFSEAAAVSASLLTFEDLLYALDNTWVLSGLGHNYGLDTDGFRKVAVLHYNGKMKPWLDLGISKYKDFWRKFLNQENQFLSDCNVNL